MKRVLLAVITEGDLCVSLFCSSLAQSIKTGLANDVEYFPVFFPANGNWPMAFNQGVTIAWRENLDGFLCVSPRVGWDALSLNHFIETNKDAVAMPVATRNGFEIRMGEIARLQDDPDSAEIKVQSASLDFFYLSRYAIDRLCKAHPTVKYNDQELKLIIQSGDIYTSYFDPSEILAYRLREQGIEIWLSSRFTARRQDTIEYTNDFAQVLKNLKANG